MVVRIRSIRSKWSHPVKTAKKLPAKRTVWTMMDAGEPTHLVTVSAVFCIWSCGFMAGVYPVVQLSQSPLVEYFAGTLFRVKEFDFYELTTGQAPQVAILMR